MIRIIARDARTEGAATRQEWEVVAEPGGHGVVSAHLVERLAELAGSVARRSAKEAVAPVSIDNLELVAPLKAGERLVVTAALEPQRAPKLAVSLVVRRAPKGPVAALAVMTFAGTSHAPPAVVLPDGAGRGNSPVTARFAAQPGDHFGAGNVLAWVQASALLSAQGALGHRATFAGLKALSVLEWLKGGEPLRLECSVVNASHGELTVLTQLTNESTGSTVLCALGHYREGDGR